MKQTILLLFIIFSSLTVEAKKMDFPLEIIAGSADLIVIGEIDFVKNNTYTFKITETIKGQHYKTISVQSFEEWLCDPRFIKLQKGQKLFLFLKKELNNWTVINGSSGELEISDDLIYLEGPMPPPPFGHNKIIRDSASLIQFKNGIRDFCKCYQFIGKLEFRNGEYGYFIQTCSDLQVSNFKSRSEFSEWLFKNMDGYYEIQKFVSIDYNSVVRPIEDFRQIRYVPFISSFK